MSQTQHMCIGQLAASWWPLSKSHLGFTVFSLIFFPCDPAATLLLHARAGQPSACILDLQARGGC